MAQAGGRGRQGHGDRAQDRRAERTVVVQGVPALQRSRPARHLRLSLRGGHVDPRCRATARPCLGSRHDGRRRPRADPRPLRPRVRVTTRWSDNDMYGHLNNAVYYELFDSAINGWLITGADADAMALPELGVVAESGCRFFRELEYPRPLDVGVRVERLGRSSITYALGLFDAESAELAAARPLGARLHRPRHRAHRPDPDRGARPARAGRGTAEARLMQITGAVLEEVGRAGALRRQPSAHASARSTSPRPRSGEVLVRIEAAGVCHSDLSVVDGNRARPVPMLLGHEASGRVELLGPGVTDLAVGQRVVMTFLPRCGECAGCATGGRMPCGPGSVSNAAGELLGGGRRLSRDGAPVHHHLGVSAFATHAVVDTRSVVAVEDDVPPAVAAVLGCAVLTGGGALLNAAPPEPGQSVMVVGLGGVGMAALLTAVALGAGDVVAVDGLASQARPGPRARRDAGAQPGRARRRAGASGPGCPRRRGRRGCRQRPGLRGSRGRHRSRRSDRHRRAAAPRRPRQPSRRSRWWPRPGP